MASKVTGGSPNDKAKRKTYGSGDRPLNNYNLFYHLECTLYHQKVCKQTPQNTFTSKLPNFKYYADLPDQFPPTPARYQGLILAEDWFMGGKKRVKKKVPGQMKMADMSRMIARLWKTAPKEIKKYISTIADIVKDRRDALREQIGDSSPATWQNDSVKTNNGVFSWALTQALYAESKRISDGVEIEMLDQGSLESISSPEGTYSQEEDEEFDGDCENGVLSEGIQAPPPSPEDDLVGDSATTAKGTCPHEEEETFDDNNWANELMRERRIPTPPPSPVNDETNENSTDWVHRVLYRS